MMEAFRIATENEEELKHGIGKTIIITCYL